MKKSHRKKRRLRGGSEARRLARSLVGQPRPARVIPDKRKLPPKHKKQILEDELL